MDNEEKLVGTIEAVINDSGAVEAEVKIRIGQDGYTPTIEVAESDKTTYILKITNKDNVIYTPNLYPSVDGKTIVEILESKVDNNLSSYVTVSREELTDNSYVYVDNNGTPSKILASDLSGYNNSINFSSYLDFPAVGDKHIFYIDDKYGKTYIYDVKKGSYILIGSDYNKIQEISGGGAE